MKKNNKITALGIFMITAVCLFFSVLYFFYSQQILDTSQTYVMFFKGSLEGLKIGAPVTYRGIKIGQITNIELIMDKKHGDIQIPVYVQFISSNDIKATRNSINYLIESGWRADVTAANLLTGTSSIELVHKPAYGTVVMKRYKKYIEFPTIAISQQQADLDKTLATAHATLKNIADFINSKELRSSLSNIDTTSYELKVLMKKLNKQITPVSADLKTTLKEVTLASYYHKTLMEYLSRHPEALMRGKTFE